MTELTLDKQHYIVHLRQFEGPLDLLLHLVKINEIDLNELPLAEITNQYLEYIDLMEELNINMESEYLIIAATLIYLKSCELLPPPPGEKAEEIEDIKAEFTKRLLEYQTFKEAAGKLSQKDKENIGIFTRPEISLKKIIATDGDEELIEVSLYDLLSSLRDVLGRLSRVREFKLHQKRYYVEDKIQYIRSRLEKEDMVSFIELLGMSKTKAEAITYFLAVLELTKELFLKCLQKTLFGDILLYKLPAETPQEPQEIKTDE